MSISETKRLNLEAEYNYKNMEAYNLINTNDFNSAKSIYKDLISIALELKNDYMHLDSIINFGITLFYCGKFLDAIDSFESALRISEKPRNDSTDEFQSCYLNVKILSNIVLACLACSQINDSRNYFKKLIATLEGTSPEKYRQRLIKQVLFIFFRVDSLSEYHNRFQNMDNFSDDLHQKTVERVMYALHVYLLKGDLEFWLDTLKKEADSFKQLKDFNGFVFSLFNQTVANYIKGASAQSLKNKVNSLVNVMNKEDKVAIESDPEKVLVDMKERFELSREIYNTLYDMELKHSSSINVYGEDLNEKRNSKAGLIKIFLKQAIRNLKEEQRKREIQLNDQDEGENREDYDVSKIIRNLEFSIELVENDEVNLDEIDLEEIDPDIFKAFKDLYHNLSMIKYKVEIKSFFKRFMYQTLGYNDRKALMDYKSKKFKIFQIKRFNRIRDGEILRKINFSSSGHKDHFYQLSLEDSSIKIYDNQGSNKFNSINIEDIKKFSIGIASENLRKKSKRSDFNYNPSNLFSFITTTRSLDFTADEETINNWFYGMKYLFNETGKKFKICNTGYFIFTKLKLKLFHHMISQYKSLSKNKENKDVKTAEELTIVKKVMDLVQKQGIQSVSFLKIFFMYIKIKGNTGLEITNLNKT